MLVESINIDSRRATEVLAERDYTVVLQDSDHVGMEHARRGV